MNDLVKEFERYGRVWLREAIRSSDLERLKRLSQLGSKPGARVARENPLFDAIQESRLSNCIQSLWSGMQPVRVVSFNKNVEANWAVPWHQDRVIVVNQKAEVAGYSNWSRKLGAWHCEPPTSDLERMLFVRIHLDRTTIENGAMEIALGSHRVGKVEASAAASTADQYPKEFTTAEAGDVLVLAMLVLHRSGSAEAPQSRRVLRVDYAPFELPKPLGWGA